MSFSGAAGQILFSLGRAEFSHIKCAVNGIDLLIWLLERKQKEHFQKCWNVSFWGDLKPFFPALNDIFFIKNQSRLNEKVAPI